MEKINDRLLSIISFVIFTINTLRYFLINEAQVINPYSLFNRVLGDVMLPVILLGFLISIFILVKNILTKKKSLLNIIFSIPLIGFVIYFFFIK